VVQCRGRPETGGPPALLNPVIRNHLPQPLPPRRSGLGTVVKFVIAGVLIIGNVTKPDLGFSAPANAEGAGYLFFTLASYAIAGWLLYSVFTANRENS